MSQTTKTAIQTTIKNKIKASSRKRADTGIVEKHPRRHACTVDAPRCSSKKETELVAGVQRQESKKTPTHRPKTESKEGRGKEEKREEVNERGKKGETRDERKATGRETGWRASLSPGRQTLATSKRYTGYIVKPFINLTRNKAS